MGEKKERPILFSADMVRAIRGGTKTQTRRVVKPQPKGFWGHPKDCIAGGVLQAIVHDDKANNVGKMRDHYIRCPYGQPGDRLWVRETWADLRGMGFVGKSFAYRADSLNKNGDEDADSERCRKDFGVKWKPSIHMPRWASRITLEVVSVRVERVQEIHNMDAVAEGCSGKRWYMGHGNIGEEEPSEEFERLWDSINAKRGFGWDANPWVWAVEFRKAP